ncbi:hypothetical protein INO88_15570, partial [Staphylococcus aureus]|nr:hypothetical protein [Staphylococcus aureus]
MTCSELIDNGLLFLVTAKFKTPVPLSDLKIVGLDFYITTEESKRFTDFPKDFKGIAGWVLEVKSNT